MALISYFRIKQFLFVLTINYSQSAELHFARNKFDSYSGFAPQLKPVVEINYEPLNEQTRRFVVQQFNVELNNTVREIVDIVLLPYGRTRRSGDGMDAVFTCPNATDNCRTLREHACVISNFYQNYTLQTLNWLYCTFARDDWLNVPTVTDECINANFLDAGTIIEVCADQVVSNQSTVILNIYADSVAALSPPLTHVPWILVNGVHNPRAEQNLIQEICDTYYDSEKPSQCIVQLLPVVIYYETMSQSVADFISTNIAPYYQYFDNISSLSLVPYGLTTFSGDQFICPNGPIQCEANKIHACFVHYFFDDENDEIERQLTLQWLNCTLSSAESDPIDIAEICLIQVFQYNYWALIYACAVGPEGSIRGIYGRMANLTDKLVPPIDYVPVVTINAARNSNAEKNLVQAICDSYSPLKPAICKEISVEPVSLALYYQSDQRSRDFAVNQLKQFYTNFIPTLRATSLQSILEVAFIPWGNTTYSTANPDQPFTCPAGVNQCHLNRIHACAISQYSNTPNGYLEIIAFIICTFQHPLWNSDPSSAGNQCANNVFILDPWPAIEVCANFEVNVYLAFRNKTLLLDPPLTDLPWITINGNRNTDAETNLLEVVCDNYLGSLPDQCFPVTSTPSLPNTSPSSPMTYSSTPSTTTTTNSTETSDQTETTTIDTVSTTLTTFTTTTPITTTLETSSDMTSSITSSMTTNSTTPSEISTETSSTTPSMTTNSTTASGTTNNGTDFTTLTTFTTTTPTTTTLETIDEHSNGLSVAEIIGIIVGSVITILLIGLLFYFRKWICPKRNYEANIIKVKKSSGNVRISIDQGNSSHTSGPSIRDSHLPDILAKQTDTIFRSNSSTERVYQMKAIPRGLCVIINNEKFARHSRRFGSEVDGQRLKQIFEKLRFRVKLNTDLTCVEMFTAIKSAQQSKYNKSGDAFVLIILSHGFEGGLIYGTDSDENGLRVERDIVVQFNDSNCPALRGKPKMFFFNTCRGKIIDRGANVTTDSRSEIEITANEEDMIVEIDYSLTRASWQDMLIASSSVERYASARDPVNGAWFANALIEQLEESARRLDLQSIMNNVTKDVLSREGIDSSGRRIKQTPSIEYRGWNKQLFFNP